MKILHPVFVLLVFFILAGLPVWLEYFIWKQMGFSFIIVFFWTPIVAAVLDDYERKRIKK